MARGPHASLARHGCAMAKRSVASAALAAAVPLGVGAAVGYWAGQERWWRWGTDQLALEVEGRVEHNLEVLSRLRTDDTAGAILLLETAMDQGVLSLAGGDGRRRLPVSTLQGVRAYRTLYPPGPKDAERLRGVFAQLPETKPEYCSPAVAAILERAQRHADAPAGSSRGTVPAVRPPARE